MSIQDAVGNFLFRSKTADKLWYYSTGSPFYLVRLFGAVIISALLVLRCGRLFINTRLGSKPVFGFVIVGTLWGGLVNTVIAGSIVGFALLTYLQFMQPTTNSGHRAGGKGFKDIAGKFVENTLEALRNLISQDQRKELKDFFYLEFDVHETADGELVILHDIQSVLTGSKDSELNAKPVAAISSQCEDISKLSVKDLKLEQLKAIHLGGKKGVHIPTLDEFLRCCKEEGLQRSMAVEIKAISTDSGREKLLQLLKDYKNTYAKQLDRTCPEKQYKVFGWVSAISFPFNWAESFGEFCSDDWAIWADKFNAAGVPVKACVLHSLNLVPEPR